MIPLKWVLRRWTLKHMWYRLRLPIRRKRWQLKCETSTSGIWKAKEASFTSGPALAFGAFEGRHGLGRAAAHDLDLLQQRHSEVIPIDISQALSGEHVKKVTLQAPVENVYFLCQPDTYWAIPLLVDAESIACAYRVGRWVWETPAFPSAWAFARNLVHEIWAPSEFCAATFRKAVDFPVNVVPYPVTAPPPTKIDMRERLGIKQDVFLGVAIMDIHSCPDRKNPWAHVQAWKEAFKGDMSAILLMKLRVSKRTRIVLTELTELCEGAKNVIFLCDELSNEEISALHHCADVYMSLHRSEGFGLNIYESLLLGKAVVATDYSANAEFGPEFQTYSGIPFTLKPYSDWLKHYADEFEYAAVDVHAAADALGSIRKSHTNGEPP